MSNPNQAQILVIDDEPDLRTLYELTLLREGYRVEAAGDLAQARAQLRDRQFDAVITDMRLPDGLGLELLREMVIQQRSERCVVITAHGSAENAVEALKAGAFDYLTKPVDLKQFRSVVASAIQGPAHTMTASGTERGRSDTDPALPVGRVPRAGGAASTLQRLVGESAVMQAVKTRIVKVAGSMAPVLIQGESGTGKELVARAVHDCSHRAAGPFVAVNCSAIPENLLEAEFFGARKGAYTGSAQDRVGYFQAAKGGTLFLDEIGDLPLAMQSKLLRAIQERVVRPLGSAQEDTVDVRVVSATHKDLGAAVASGVFRQDLYYRLNVIEISLPPLRERREDLPALCEDLMGRICRESGLRVPEISAQVLASLQVHPFQGNVRELENILHRAVALGEDGDLHLESPAAEYVAVPGNLQAFLDGQERSILCKVLQETGFNRTAAAAKLGISLRQIRYRIARLNIVTPHSDDVADDAL
ncbi:sigma-54 dependent transcriptional regulator [Polaromonas sp.]|uniref:sigma-54-dependent transcriptional regulator n=1 Tax=Polaromonas sp. TaxID=1869339 RepID=UPI0027308B6C|nr:sigma-54 dependent transcriptional regulator [Polaromonas sp.]MDP1740420.1 sigma-54 dependent transcriptional regulator [Polaromonas sp.]